VRLPRPFGCHLDGALAGLREVRSDKYAFDRDGHALLAWALG
jgi:hypothetical protein